MKSKGLKRADIPVVVPAKFWKLVKAGGPQECWHWLGTERIKNSYGQIGFNYSYHLAHVVSFVLSIGDVPSGMCVLHTCDNRKCCNPNHLFLGTKADNNTDRRKKNRDGDHKGELNGRAILTAEKVVTIRNRFQQGLNTHDQLAQEFGVCKVTIKKVVSRSLWPHIP